MNEYLKLSPEEQKALYTNFLQEPDAFYEKNGLRDPFEISKAVIFKI